MTRASVWRASWRAGARGGSLPIQRRAILFPSEGFSLAQPHRLERLSTLDSVRQSSAHLGHESLLILRISQTLGRKLCGSKVEVGAGKLRALLDGIRRPNSLIPNHLRRRGALLKEFALLEYPAVAVSLDLFVLDLPLSIPLGTLHRDGVDRVGGGPARGG